MLSEYQGDLASKSQSQTGESLGPIAQIHYSARRTDGVALQMMETAQCLTALGETVYLCAADVREAAIPELDYRSPPVWGIREAILHANANTNKDELLSKIESQADRIHGRLQQIFDRHGIRIAHIRNISSAPLPYFHLPAALAVYRLIQERPDIGFVLHHHDLNWQALDEVTLPEKLKTIEDMADQALAPNFANTSHIVINSLAAKELERRRHIKATVIPDGFDFNRETHPIDESEFLKDFGLGENDLLIGMMCRIIPRKAIENALLFVQALERRRHQLESSRNGIGPRRKSFGPESRIFLVLPQSADRDDEYFQKIQKLAGEMNVNLCFIGDKVVADSSYNNSKVGYPFYSVYRLMDMIVYPSRREEFGNQALEAAWAKRALVMHIYPVAETDIIPKVGSDCVISLGNNNDLRREGDLYFLDQEVVNQAANQAIAVLLNPQLYQSMTELAYKRFRKFYDIREITERYIDIYQQLLTAHC